MGLYLSSDRLSWAKTPWIGEFRNVLLVSGWKEVWVLGTAIKSHFAGICSFLSFQRTQHKLRIPYLPSDKELWCWQFLKKCSVQVDGSVLKATVSVTLNPPFVVYQLWYTCREDLPFCHDVKYRGYIFQIFVSRWNFEFCIFLGTVTPSVPTLCIPSFSCVLL